MIRSLGQSLRLEGGKMYIKKFALVSWVWDWQYSYITVPAAVLREIDKIAKFNEQEKTASSCDKTFYTCEVLSCCSLVYDRNNSSSLDTGASLLLAICTARYCVDIGISTHRNIHDMIIISMLRRYDCVLAGHLYKRCADSNKWLVRWFRLYQVHTLVSSS